MGAPFLISKKWALPFFFLRAHFLNKKKMGRAPMMRPFFFYAHFLNKKKWARRPLSAHFFCETPIFSKKKSWATGWLDFSIFFCVLRPFCDFCANFPPFFFLKRPLSQKKKKWAKRPFFAHYFFFFLAPIFSKKKSWAVRPWCAHQFFFPPMTLISLRTRGFQKVIISVGAVT